MMIWLIALLLIGGLGAAGRTVGAVRFSVSLVGLLLAKKLAFALAPLVSEKAGGIDALSNPALQYTIPPILLWVVVVIVFSIIAQVVHQQVSLYFRYKVIDEKRVMFERMNDGVGITMGAANGVVALIALLSLIQAVGYPATQWESSSSNPGPVRFAGSLYTSMKSCGLERIAEAATPLSDNYYLMADCFGLIYNNPSAARRLTTYPETIILSESPAWKAVANDATAGEIINSQGNVVDFLGNPSVVGILKNPTELDKVMAIDFTDLYTYLQTGESPKYKDEQIMGRWYLSIKGTTVAIGQQIRDRLENVNTLRYLSMALAEHAADLEMIAGAGNQVLLKGSIESVDMLRGMVTGTRIPPPSAVPPGRRPGQRPPPQETPEAFTESGEPGAATAQEGGAIILTGTWESKGSQPGGAAYQITWEGNQSDEVLIDPLHNLRIHFAGGRMIFYPAEGK